MGDVDGRMQDQVFVWAPGYKGYHQLSLSPRLSTQQLRDHCSSDPSECTSVVSSRVSLSQQIGV